MRTAITWIGPSDWRAGPSADGLTASGVNVRGKPMKSYNVGNLARLAAVSLACWAGAGAITASAQQADETMPDLTTLADGPVRWY